MKYFKPLSTLLVGVAIGHFVLPRVMGAARGA